MFTFYTNTDSFLADFTYDYIDDVLDDFERLAFDEYLSTNNPLAAFVYQAIKGKQALKNAYKVKAADSFEEKLFKQIAQEKEEDKPEENYTSA